MEHTSYISLLGSLVVFMIKAHPPPILISKHLPRRRTTRRRLPRRRNRSSWRDRDRRGDWDRAWSSDRSWGWSWRWRSWRLCLWRLEGGLRGCREHARPGVRRHSHGRSIGWWYRDAVSRIHWHNVVSKAVVVDWRRVLRWLRMEAVHAHPWRLSMRKAGFGCMMGSLRVHAGS